MNRETCPELGGLFKLSSRHPILAWNSKAVLPTCLESLSGEIFRDFEVILVVNGSQDEAPDDLKEKYAMLNLCVERLDANRGFASANNLGARLACGQWLSLLNTDAFPEPDWLEKLLRAEQYAKHIPVPRTGA